MRVIPDLDAKNLARAQIPQGLRLETAAQFLHFAEAKKNLSLRVKKGRRFRSTGTGRGPSREQWIPGYHHLQQPAFAATLPALFL